MFSCRAKKETKLIKGYCETLMEPRAIVWGVIQSQVFSRKAMVIIETVKSILMWNRNKLT